MPWSTILGLILLGLVTSCGGNDNPNANQIVPITADITINPPGAGDVVYLERIGASNDLVTIDVKLRMNPAQEFNQFDLYFRFDPLVMQFAGEMQVPESDGLTFNPFGECGSASTYCGRYPAGGTCDGGTSLCTFPPDSVGDMCAQDSDCEQPGTLGPINCQTASTVPGELPLGQIGNINSGQCASFDLSGPIDVRLIRLAFNVTTVTTGTRLELISRTLTGKNGDCAILQGQFVDLGIPCDDGMATITGSR